MKKVLFLTALFIFIIAGVASAILVAMDWNSVVSDENFTGLGVLLFLIGAGIGAILVLLIAFISSRLRKSNTSSETETKEQHEEKESYNIEVKHEKGEAQFTGLKQKDVNLLKKLGYTVSNVFRKLHVKVYSARIETETSGVFTPTQKSWEKNIHPLESVSTATPRIFVLPPDPPTDPVIADIAKTARTKSRQENSRTGKITKMPDVTILDIKPSDSNEEEVKVDSENSSMFLSQSSELKSIDNENSTETNSPVQNSVSESLALEATISMIDNNLGEFVRSLMHENNKRKPAMTYMLSIMIEEVLPRPDSGLLKRMLRMSEIPVGMVEGSGEPILHLRIGSECHISVSLIDLNDTPSESIRLTGPHSITLKPVDGEEAVLDVNCEEVDNIEQIGSAFWDLKKHSSPSLVEASKTSSASTVLTPIEMTLEFQVHHDNGDENEKKMVYVQKTIMSRLRSDLANFDEQERLVHEDSVVEFVLSKMELISMPSLLMFLNLNENNNNNNHVDSNKDQV
eukprot:g2198.t1